MADFKTHVTASSIVGLGYGGVAYFMAGMQIPDCILAATFCGMAGMLPDIDSGPGRPLREITGLLAVMVPSMLLVRLYQSGMPQSLRILVALGVYVVIRYGLRELLKRYTVHRGMFHSLAAVAIFGELAFLLMYGEEMMVRWFIAGGVVAGCLSHLILDEIYSVEWNGRPRLKKSFGTAIKFIGKGWWPNVSAYGKLALLTAVVILDPSLVQHIRDGEASDRVQELASDLDPRSPDSFGRPPAMSLPGSAPVDLSPAPPFGGQPSVGRAVEQSPASPWGNQPARPPYVEQQPQNPYERTATLPTYPNTAPPPTYQPASPPPTYAPTPSAPPVNVPNYRY
jgi:hypothetical protein